MDAKNPINLRKPRGRSMRYLAACVSLMMLAPIAWLWISSGAMAQSSDQGTRTSYITAVLSGNTFEGSSSAVSFVVTWYDASNCSEDYNAYLSYTDTDETSSRVWIGSTGSLGDEIAGSLTSVGGSNPAVELYCGAHGATDSDNLVTSVPVDQGFHFCGVTAQFQLCGSPDGGSGAPVTYSTAPPLISLAVSPGTLTPAFHRAEGSYSVPDVPHNSDQVTIHASEAHGYDIELVNSGSEGLQDADPDVPGFQIDLDVGTNDLRVYVYATRGGGYQDLKQRVGNSRHYGFTVTRAPADDGGESSQPSEPVPSQTPTAPNGSETTDGATKTSLLSVRVSEPSDSGSGVPLYARWYDGANCATQYYVYLLHEGHVSDGENNGSTAVSHLGTVLSSSSVFSHSLSSYGPGIAFDFALYCGTRNPESDSNLVASVEIPKVGGESGNPPEPGWYETTIGHPLMSLSVSPGPLTPRFQRDDNVSDYTVPDVLNDVDQLTFQAFDLPGYDTVFLNGDFWVYSIICDGNYSFCSISYGADILEDADPLTPGFQVDIDVGENRFSIHVREAFRFHGPFTDVTVTRLEPNQPATGAPTIAGTPTVGETLTAETSAIADEDGLDKVSYSYQWVQSDGGTEEDIAGATGASYTLEETDQGKTVKVKVTFTDDAGNEETLISDATEAVAEVLRPAFWEGTLTVGEGTYNGVVWKGYTFGRAALGSISSPSSVVVGQHTYRVKLILHNATDVYLGMSKEIPEDFVLQVGDVEFDSEDASGEQSNASYYLYRWPSIALDWSEGDQILVTLRSAAMAAALPENIKATGAPTVSGVPTVGQTLTAVATGIRDSNGMEAGGFRYQWISNNGADDSEIAGATGASYTLVDADEGKTIRVRVSFTDRAQYKEAVVSAAVGPVVARPNNPATGAPTIGGTVQVGQTLTASTAGISDADGLTNATFAYQWLASSDAEISGATNATYTLVDTDEGKTIKVRVSFTDDRGNQEALTSVDTGAVAAGTNSPATGAPTIIGTVQVGETLTASPSSILDTDGLTNATFAYQWLADDAEINGATAGSYTLVDDDEGKTIKVRVSFTDDVGNGEDLTSAATAAVAPKPNTPATGAPSITGTARVGETLTADTAGISDGDGLTNATFGYQWLADDAEINGATNSTHTLVDTDEGKTIKVRVSFTDDRGNQEALTSVDTGAVAAGTNSPATGAPTIIGTVQVGETLTASPSSILDTDGLTNATFAYQWLADDAEINGATAGSYTLVDDDEGKTIKVRVSFTDDVGNGEDLTSAATAAVAPKPNTPATGAPTITGTARVGETLTADTAGISDGDGLTNATFAYQWLADGAEINGATSSTYTLLDSRRR